MSMHLLLEGSDLGELLAEVRGQHGPAARVVRAERIRSGGVAGFFSKERYEVTVEMDGAGGDDVTHAEHQGPQPAPQPASQPASEVEGAGQAPEAPGSPEAEEREALDFEALLAAADAAETAASTTPAAPIADAEVEAGRAGTGEAFESARAGLLEVLRASQQGPALPAAGPDHTGLKVSGADAEDRNVIARTGEGQHAASSGLTHSEEAADAPGSTPDPAPEHPEEFPQEFLEEEHLDEHAAQDAAAAFEAELLEQARVQIERAEIERAAAERAEIERAAAERAEIERAAAERAEIERAAAARAAAERAQEEERMQQLEMERREAERAEQAHREAVRAQEARREAARADVRRRQAERVSAPRPAAGQVPAQVPGQARSLGDVLAAADAADGTDRLGAMFAAGQAGERRPERGAGERAARPHRPISTESDSFARTLASMRDGATRTPGAGVTADVRSVTTPVRSVRPRPGHPDARPARTPEERVSDQFGTTNGATREGRGPARRPELRRPAAVEDQFADQFGDQFADQFGDQFGDRFEVERSADRAADRRGEWAHDYDQLEQQVAPQSFYEQENHEKGYEPGYERPDERPARSYPPAARATERGVDRVTDRAVNRDGDDNEAMTMDLTYREPVTTYSERPGSSRATYREPQDTGDVLRLARDIDVPAPLRVGAGELVVVIGEADAVVAAALLVADEVGSEAPLVLGRADVQNTVTADELPARQDQARRWSAPLTVAVPARPTGADAERAARMAAEIGAASVVVCVDATRRSHAVASLLRALDGVGLPARRLAVHRAAESPDPLDVLSLDVPVGFLDGRPATSGAWAGLLLDAAGDHPLR
ncbi:hypothetical protein AB2L27_14820 [Kineococcus sp. LSe6-4]|uniref:Uncharacterized protein n=1 Tax=Kineococcus halophytocola TaxID=3234027 RepID=A0ABV4H408_9ACTN